MSLYDERLKRTLDAIHMDPVDKIPFSYSGPAYVARREGLKMSTFVSDFAAATEASVKFCQSHPGIDSIHSPVMAVGLLPMLWLTQVRRPGVELPDDELWQLDEQEIISYDDYQKILDMGYGPWLDAFLKEKLDDPMAKMVPFFQYWPTTVERMTKEAQVPIMNYSTGSTAFEGLCGGRTLMSFFDDIAEEPELIKQVMDNAHEYNMQSFCAQLDATHPPFVWVGGWRAAPSMLSHDTWMDLVWPYLKPMILACVERNVVPVLHFDSCWDREIETLKELPAKKCLLMMDGSTDMRRAREILDDRMCLMGDVPATMLAFGSADEVYKYVTDMIRDVGPKTGLIVSSGCDCPLNAKDECADAMIQATLDWSVG